MKNKLDIKQGCKDWIKVDKQVRKIVEKWGIKDFLNYDDLMDLRHVMVQKGLENLGYTKSQIEQINLNVDFRKICW